MTIDPSSPIPQPVLAVLDGGVAFTPDGRGLVIKQKLDRGLYAKTAAVLEALGGPWNRKAKAHLFPDDARARLEEALTSGTYVRATALDFFETPPELGNQLAFELALRPGDVLLEPSAGHGALIQAARRTFPYDFRVLAVEAHPDRARLLWGNSEILNASVIEGDFLLVGVGQLSPRPTAALMNPPFSKQQDILHVRHAFDLLAPGGRLSAIMSAGVRFRENSAAKDFRAWVEDLGGWFADLPEKSFAASGTHVSACRLFMKKPA